MADGEWKEEEDHFKKLRKKKRKQRHGGGEIEDEEEEHQGSSKSSRANLKTEPDPRDSQKHISLELGSPWMNLHLILLLQNKEIDIQRKLVVASDYVQFRARKDKDDVTSCQVLETVSISRVIFFINNWIQSVLISSAKRTGDERCEGQLETYGSYLDYRCWVILKFCLEESIKLNASLSFSRDILLVIDCITRDTLIHLSPECIDSKESALSSEKLEFQDIVLDCISLIFTCRGGILNENLDLWIMVVEKVLKLVQEVFKNKMDNHKAGVFIIQFSCYLLKPFAKFLTVRPARKNGFRDFVDRLLEHLMYLLDELHLSTYQNPGWTGNLLKLVGEVLSQGIFHPIHIDGFLSLQSTTKYKICDDEKSKERPIIIKSYHRHLFEKLQKITSLKNGLPLGGVGELFRLFVKCLTKQKGISSTKNGSDGRVLERISNSDTMALEKYDRSGSVNSETRKQLFDFFVQIMEQFILSIDSYTEAELNVGDSLLDVVCLFRSVNKLLASFKNENIYARTEDSSEGACINFLRFIYQTIMSFSAKIKHSLLSMNSDSRFQREMLLLIAKEIVVALHHLMDTEYEVVGDDLESLWFLILTFTACSRSVVDVSDQHFLSLEILHLGCSLIDLYSELRQVNNPIFALCKAVRLLASAPVANEAYPLHFFSSYSNSLSSLICSAKFRLSIRNAIKSIPEGQASGSIQLLTADISESLEWLKVQLNLGHANNLSKLGCGDSSLSWPNLETELLGRIVAEVYTLVLDSMIVTAGNSIAVGRSIEKLMELMSSSKGRDLLQPDIMDKFLCMVSGRTYCLGVGFDNDSLLCWLLVFLFRLYLSCRSLYREVISLVPPDTSKKMSETMGDFHTAYAGKDWLEGIIQNDEGYFSWIIKPSATLLSVIHNVSNIYLQDNLAIYPPLVYVLIAMSIQRLVDLNGVLNSFDYLLARNNKLVNTKLIDDTGMSLLHKRSKKWTKCLSKMKQEAAGLTKLMMSWLTLLVKDSILISFNNGLCENLSVHDLHKEIAWDLSVGSLNEKSLPSAIWWIVCQHVDIWCGHATKKDLKKFVTNLIRSSLPFGSAGMNRVGLHCTNKLTHVKYVTIHQSSLELLNDTGLNEQRFFCRHIVSRICRILEASLTSSDSEEGYLNSKPDWSEVIKSLEILSNGLSNQKCSKNDQVSQMNLISRSLPKLHADLIRTEQLDLSSNIKYALCCSLLNFLIWMPKEVLSSKSFLQLVTCILNVEQVVVGNLLHGHKVLFEGDRNDLFRLFLTCRRTLKSLLASCDGKMVQDRSILIFILSESSSSVLWLLKSLSAVMGVQSASVEDIASQLQDVLFSLMDQTSYVLLTISRYQFELAMQFSRVSSDGKHGYAIVCQGTKSNEDEARSYLCCDNDPWRSLALLNEVLREHKKSFCSRFNEPYLSEKFGVLPEFLELRKLSSVISCIQGFLWGLAFALANIDAGNDKIRAKLSKCNTESLYKLNIFMEECAKSLTHFLHLLFFEGEADRSLKCAQNTDFSDSGCVHSGQPEYKVDDAQSCGPVDDTGPHNVIGVSDKRDVRGKLHTENADVESLLANVELFDQQCLKRTLLQDLLQGENPEVAFFLKQLLLSASAIMKLQFKLNFNSLLENLTPALFGISQLLLVGFANMVTIPPLSSFVWLDGVVKFVEELGNCFPSSSPVSSRKLYVKLVDLHLRCIGKCIALQGKRATLASKESESSIKNPIVLSFSVSSPSDEICYVGNLKLRLRMSFRALVQKSSELHLLSAIQALERAIVGVQEGCSTNYEIHAGNLDGGKVTSTVAAGIDCLDLVIEFVTGHKRVKMVRRHIQGLVACLLNIILHLQGPSIFFESVNCNGGCTGPDSGAIILMCIDILRKVSGKHGLFEMDACHVGQFLNIPAALFQDLLQIQLFEVRHLSNSLSLEETIDTCSVKSINGGILDRRYLLELYTTCCRLLCSVVKHHASETQRCSALLQHSVGVLLQCLEMVKINSYVSGANFAWEVQDGVRCACCLRRVYEEIRQQKDSIGRYCYQFLSGYIRIYCGFGVHKTGIIREVDEALRPGVYALIDACSADDLQRLHTAFGEGPCRTTLATLRNDYALHFQYQGKV